MAIDISYATMVATVVASFVGAVFFIVSMSLSNFRKQKRQAEEIKNKIAASGRDPADPATWTPAERWDIEKCAKFDKIFLLEDFLAVIIGTGLATALLILFGDRYLEDAYAEYGVVAFFAGLIVTLVMDQTFLRYVAKGEFDKKAEEWFQNLRKAGAEQIEDVKASAKSKVDIMVDRLVAEGFSKTEARKLAKDKVAEEILNKTE